MRTLQITLLFVMMGQLGSLFGRPQVPLTSDHANQIPGGLADAGGRVGYVSSSSGGIEALDLMTGEVLWSSSEAQIPLLLTRDRLYAQAGIHRNRMRVIVFDLAHRGEVLLESDSIQFPSWVVTSDSPGHSFHLDPHLDHDLLSLSWKARKWHHSINKPMTVETDKVREQGEGQVRVDLSTGKVFHLAGELSPESVNGFLPEKDLEKKTVRWQGIVHGQFKAVVMEQDAQGQHIRLLSWDETGKSSGPGVELIAGRRLAVLPTLDDQVIGIREMMPSPDARPIGEDKNRYSWSLFSLETGELRARVGFEPSTQGMVVQGNRLLVVQSGSLVGMLNQSNISSRNLKAIDLKTGKLLWQHSIAGKIISHHEN